MLDINELKTHVRTLSAAERVELMEKLLASFEPTPDESVSRVWMEEIDRRRKAYREGRVDTVTVEESRRRLA